MALLDASIQWLLILTQQLRRIDLAISALDANRVSAIANVFLAIAAFVALPVGLVQLSLLRRSREHERLLLRNQAAKDLLTTYLKEYRSPEMGRAIGKLWDLYRAAKKDPSRIVYLYEKLYHRQRTHAFHYDIRRKVSAFYQELALFVEKDVYARQEIYGMWAKANLGLIPKVLLPIETVAIPRILERDSSPISVTESLMARKAEHSIKVMLQLYENAPDI